jgi:hypothetical protein
MPIPKSFSNPKCKWYTTHDFCVLIECEWFCQLSCCKGPLIGDCESYDNYKKCFLPPLDERKFMKIKEAFKK